MGAHDGELRAAGRAVPRTGSGSVSPNPVRRTAEPADRYLVRSVARALQAVDLVADGPVDGRSLSEIARLLGMSKSAAYAMLRTLVSRGFLRESGPGPRYQLGLALIRLGDVVTRQVSLGEVCRPVLAELSARTGMTARVAISDEGFPVFLARVDGPGTVRFHTPLGQRESAHTSSAGKAILAELPVAEVRRIVEQSGLSGRTPHSIVDIDTLFADLALTRRRGFALDDEEDAIGVFCVGAACFDHSGRCAGAVSVTGIKVDLPAWRVEEIGRVVRDHADRVSTLLGGRRQP